MTWLAARRGIKRCRACPKRGRSNTGTVQFSLRDPDGDHVTISAMAPL